MLNEICGEIRNYFAHTPDDIHDGTFTITGGVLTSSFLTDGQYYRIIGSLFNDGVHKYGDSDDTLTDETFKGAVWAMYVPPEVVTLAADVSAWVTKYGGAVNSPYASESFGGYTYSIGRGSWKAAFKDRLSRWRKINAL